MKTAGEYANAVLDIIKTGNVEMHAIFIAEQFELYASELKKDRESWEATAKATMRTVTSQDAEIDGLKTTINTEVSVNETLRIELSKQQAELQHLRELISKVKKAIVEDAIHWDPAKANELLQDCEKALNPQTKP